MPRNAAGHAAQLVVKGLQPAPGQFVPRMLGTPAGAGGAVFVAGVIGP